MHEYLRKPDIQATNEVVTRAIVVAQTMLFEHVLEEQGLLEVEELMFQPYIRRMYGKAVERQSVTANKIVLTLLNGESRRYFDRMALLASYGESQDGNILLRENADLQQYFLVRTRKGVWYAGNPALTRPTSPVGILLQGENVSEILSQIQQGEGGSWPVTAFVEQVLSKHNNQMPMTEPSSAFPPTCTEIRRYTLNGDVIQEAHDRYLFPYRNGEIYPLFSKLHQPVTQTSELSMDEE